MIKIKESEFKQNSQVNWDKGQNVNKVSTAVQLRYNIVNENMKNTTININFIIFFIIKYQKMVM